MDDETRKKRLSSRSSMAAIDESHPATTDKRKTSKSRPTVEAVSEIALNTLDESGHDERALSVKRYYSAPGESIAKSNNNRDSRSHKRMSQNQDEPPEYYPPEQEQPLPYKNNVQKSSHIQYVRGHVNQAFVGQVHHSTSINPIATNRVHQEQYWTLPCCRWHQWSRREKNLSYVIIVQALMICGLLIALITYIAKNGEIDITKPNGLKPPWKL